MEQTISHGCGCAHKAEKPTEILSDEHRVIERVLDVAADSQAGAFSPFFMRITRGDGEQEITRFDTVLPPGLVGKIAGLGR